MLVDEWQRYTPVWDMVRRDVDRLAQPGLCGLAGRAIGAALDGCLDSAVREGRFTCRADAVRHSIRAMERALINERDVVRIRAVDGPLHPDLEGLHDGAAEQPRAWTDAATPVRADVERRRPAVVLTRQAMSVVLCRANSQAFLSQRRCTMTAEWDFDGDDRASGGTERDQP